MSRIHPRDNFHEKKRIIICQSVILVKISNTNIFLFQNDRHDFISHACIVAVNFCLSLITSCKIWLPGHFYSRLYRDSKASRRISRVSVAWWRARAAFPPADMLKFLHGSQLTWIFNSLNMECCTLPVTIGAAVAVRHDTTPP